MATSLTATADFGLSGAPSGSSGEAAPNPDLAPRGCVINGHTRVVGVWGHPVSHSRSPAMHNAAIRDLGLNWAYVPFEVNPARIGAAVEGARALGIIGVNVTVPLKELLPPLLDELDDSARRTGSVNTIVNRDGHLTGHSTDGVGFLRALQEAGAEARGTALVLGAGGSGRAVAHALAERGCRVRLSNRTSSRAVDLAHWINASHPGLADVVGWGDAPGRCDLVINTTSLGMTPSIDEMPPVGVGTFDSHPFVYDLVYSPLETRFLAAAREAGCRAENGLMMLVYQGAEALSLWTGIPVEELPVSVMARTVLADLA